MSALRQSLATTCPCAASSASSSTAPGVCLPQFVDSATSSPPGELAQGLMPTSRPRLGPPRQRGAVDLA